MKLIIQIPCYNEENTLESTLNALPRQIEGVDSIEILIINDGSTDKTVDVAKNFGVEHIVTLNKNYGLARAFSVGLSKCLELGADIIVNTDGDNQYCAENISDLIKPILLNSADMVVGTRPISDIKHFSPLKKFLQKLGSAVMKLVSRVNVEDAPSGFRAFSKKAAMTINIFDNYTYTLESIIQANAKGLKIVNVPIKTNSIVLRKSRLFSNIFVYVIRSILTMSRMFIVYRPFRFFIAMSVLFLLIGSLIGARFLYFYITESGVGHIQSLILSSILIMTGVQIAVIAVLSDLLAINRKLLEDIQIRMKNLEIKR